MGGALVGDITTIEDVSAEREVEIERERIARFQEQMLAIVGHDLRNPLAALVVGIESVEIRSAELPAFQPLVRRMKSASNRMTRIVEQLLDVTRARLGTGIPIARRESELTPMIRGVVDELAASHPDATFELVVRSEIRGAWDVDRLSQVVSNLASNALQYGNRAEPIVIELSATEDQATLTVANAVRDKPIEAERLDVIFDPYQRGRDAHANASGLGLGLYIVSEIVKAHQGTIRAESVGSRTVFYVQLPLRAPDAGE
jgi:signal transduction histidine kinase